MVVCGVIERVSKGNWGKQGQEEVERGKKGEFDSRTGYDMIVRVNELGD